MTRGDWGDSNTALRHLLKDLGFTRDRLADNLFQYKFGAFYDARHNRGWVIYNGVSDNVIAVVRKRDNELIIRYRPNSKYAHIFKGRIEGWGQYRISRIPSGSLGRYRDSARIILRSQVLRNIEEFKHLEAVMLNSQNLDYLQMVDHIRDNFTREGSLGYLSNSYWGYSTQVAQEREEPYV